MTGPEYLHWQCFWNLSLNVGVFNEKEMILIVCVFENVAVLGEMREPSVDHVLGTSPSQSLAKAEPRKSTIGQRKPLSAKKGVRGHR